jgi:hypothetical protein
MRVIVIYGVGRQGVAAISALKPSLDSATVLAIDEFWDAKTRAAIAQYSKKIKFFQNLRELNELYPDLEIDLYIDTSVCLGRIQRLTTINSWYRVKTAFIEKPLFNIKQSSSDYAGFDHNAYVNIPRRNWSLYKFLYSLGPINGFDLEATNWGLLCNVLHYTDAFSHGNNDFNLRIKTHKLLPIYARRKGFMDALGEIVFEDSKGRSLRLSSVEQEIPEKLVVIIGGKTYQVDEAKGTVSDDTGKILFEDKNHIIKSFDFLSDLSNLESSLSAFPKFSEVFNANEQIVDMLEKHYPNLLGQFT